MTNHAPTQDSGPTRHAIEQQIASFEADINNYHTQIDSLRNRICDLKSTMNDETLIGRLHPEILAEVFLHHVERCMKITKIGRNPLAFQTPRLWTKFGPAFPEFVRESVRHSGILPLEILAPTATVSEDCVAQSFGYIMEQVSRLRSVQLVLSMSLRGRLRDPQMKNLSAPLLETLHLTSHTYGGLFPAFTTMSMPRLTSLTLVRGSFKNLQIMAHERITHLTLVNIRNAPLPQFLDIIGRLPALVRLSTTFVCEIVWPWTGDTGGTPVPAEGLRHLTHLSVVNRTPFSTAFILHHLHIPVQANVRLCSDGDVSYDEAVYMLQRIRERVFLPLRATSDTGSPPPRPRIRALRLHAHRDWDTVGTVDGSIAAWTEEVSESTLQFELYPEDARFVFRIRGADDIMAILVDHLLVQEELDSVTMLALRCSPPIITPHVWARLFMAMPKLRWLNLEYQAADAFAAYHNSPTHASSRTPPLPLYPSLKHLNLTGTRFARCWSGPHGGDLLPDLVTALTAAKDQGLHLERLQLDVAGNLTDEGLDMLRETGCADVVEMMDDGEESNGACSTPDHERSAEGEGEYEEENINVDADVNEDAEMDSNGF